MTLPAFTLPTTLSGPQWGLAKAWYATMALNLFYPLAATLVLMLLLAYLLRRRLSSMLLGILLAPLLVATAACLLRYTLPAAPPPRPAQTALRVAQLNSLYWNNEPAAKVAFAQASQADIISLVEASSAVRDGLAINPPLPYAAYTPRLNRKPHLNMLLLSRWPIQPLQHWGPRLWLYRILRPSAPFYVLQVHPLSPSNPQDAATRNMLLAAVAATKLPTPLIAVGDFNAANWDPHLLALSNQLVIPTLQAPTFPSLAPFTPIDHVFASPGIPIPHLQRVRVENTDHLGLIADFPVF